jgi:hypothetical protein
MDNALEPMSQNEMQAWILTGANDLEGDVLRAVATFIKTNNDIADFFQANDDVRDRFIEFMESK